MEADGDNLQKRFRPNVEPVSTCSSTGKRTDVHASSNTDSANSSLSIYYVDSVAPITSLIPAASWNPFEINAIRSPVGHLIN